MALLHRNLRPAYLFIVLTAIAYLFSRIYTNFSQGETSETLALVWIFLLCFGADFFILAAVIFTLAKRRLYQFGLEVYGSGVLAYAAGMSVRGLFEILGNDKGMIKYYEFAGIGLMAAGFVLIVVCSLRYSAARSDADVFELFMEENTIDKQFATQITTRELYSRYINWAYDKRYSPVNMGNFTKKLKKNYEVLHIGIANNVVIGLAFRKV